MVIHPLWYLCISVRVLSILLLNKFKNYKKIITSILLLISIGFIYQSIYSSNETFQISKVFWHDARMIHGVLYLLATYYFYINDIKMTTILLITDIVFSMLYRIIKNK